MEQNTEKKTLDLMEIRDQIDEVDHVIVGGFQKRMELVRSVAEYKIENHIPVLDPKRENDKIAELSGLAHSRFNQRGIRDIFMQMMSISRKMQYRLLSDAGVFDKYRFDRVEEIRRNGVKVVFQGVPGAYAHEASLQFFGDDSDVYHVPTWKAVMDEVQSGKADYGVLPIENSSAGAVSDVYDLLVAYDNVIVAETYLKVAHVLAALPGAKLEDIKTVYSHAQGLMQCSDFLETYDMNRVALSNTAIAAKTVAEGGDLTVAAICSERAAALQGLTVLKKPVNNNRTNTTRFIIISGKRIYARDAERVTICFETHHEPGALYRLLSHIIYNSLNMTGIESRPIPEKNWEYRFFVDFEGNLDDPGVSSALHGIEAEASVMKILGNY